MDVDKKENEQADKQDNQQDQTKQEDYQGGTGTGTVTPPPDKPH